MRLRRYDACESDKEAKAKNKLDLIYGTSG